MAGPEALLDAKAEASRPRDAAAAGYFSGLSRATFFTCRGYTTKRRSGEMSRVVSATGSRAMTRFCHPNPP